MTNAAHGSGLACSSKSSSHSRGLATGTQWTVATQCGSIRLVSLAPPLLWWLPSTSSGRSAPWPSWIWTGFLVYDFLMVSCVCACFCCPCACGTNSHWPHVNPALFRIRTLATPCAPLCIAHVFRIAHVMPRSMPTAASLAAVTAVLTTTVAPACAVRMVGFAARAAYLLGDFQPSLQGIYLAFTNAGYGASLINVFLVTAVWYVQKRASSGHEQLPSHQSAVKTAPRQRACAREVSQ